MGGNPRPPQVSFYTSYLPSPSSVETPCACVESSLLQPPIHAHLASLSYYHPPSLGSSSLASCAQSYLW